MHHNFFILVPRNSKTINNLIQSIELPSGTEGKAGARSGSENSNAVNTKKSGSGFFGSKSRRIKLHSNQAWQEKTRIILQR